MRRIVYLGGLAHGGELSPHMRSRAETGNILRSSGIPVIEFRASIVIGSGSASFEMIRASGGAASGDDYAALGQHGYAQPIAIEDVIEYLAAAIGVPSHGNLTVEIGGSRRYFVPGDHAGISRANGNCGDGFCAVPIPQSVVIEPLADARHTRVCLHRPLPDRKRPQLRA